MKERITMRARMLRPLISWLTIGCASVLAAGACGGKKGSGSNTDTGGNGGEGAMSTGAATGTGATTGTGAAPSTGGGDMGGTAGAGGSDQGSGGDGMGGELGGAGGDGAGGTGDTSLCNEHPALDPQNLSWQPLPSIGSNSDLPIQDPQVAVDAHGTIYVATSIHNPNSPASSQAALVVVRYEEGNGWQVVGNTAVFSQNPMVAYPLAGGLAIDEDGAVFALLVRDPPDDTANQGSRVYMASGTSNWQVLSTPGIPVALTHDAAGQVLVMTATESAARVYRRQGTSWEALGDAFEPEAGSLLGNADWWRGRLATNCRGQIAATFQGSVFLFGDDSWQSLGRYATEESINWVQFPRIALPPSGQPIVTFRADYTAGGSDVMTVIYNPDGAQFEPMDSPLEPWGTGSPLPNYSTVATNDAGNVFLAWRESDIHLAHFTEGSWAPVAGSGSLHQSGTIPSITVDRTTGLPVVAWYACGDAQCPPYALGRVVRD